MKNIKERVYLRPPLVVAAAAADLFVMKMKKKRIKYKIIYIRSLSYTFQERKIHMIITEEFFDLF